MSSSLCVPGLAIQRHHRPWFMIGRYASAGSHSPARLAGVSPALRPTAAAKQDVASRKIAAAPVKPAYASPTVEGNAVARQALKYKGTRYKYGGTTKKGLDCSGLVARVYNDLKLHKIPRVSDQLYKAGQPVAMSDLRPGDLIFFKNTSRRGISHVGVYAGHNKFVHAANHRRGVIVTAMSDPYYQLHYAGARRLY
ncbi:MAG TPA: C40 family peptidase [Elusimicrobiota bacterium]|nr:C40 family peptidase [Elusimicrobiota bacterium]